MVTEDHTEYDVSEELAHCVAPMSYLVLTLPARETSFRPARHSNHLRDILVYGSLNETKYYLV